ncbi:catalase [Motilimonas pumila]|uniref:Catalase n=2 Tax=Motilimonas pumila TaxID=2303987 RepID=A0A418YL24_9GAMM|nr:catalase [Motilimonas pumila]
MHPQIDAARQDARHRELIPKTTQAEAYPAESEVGSEKDKAKSQQAQSSNSQNNSNGRVEERQSQGQQGSQQDNQAQDQQEQAQNQSADGRPNSARQEPGELTPEEEIVLDSMQARHREVVIHEQAHASVGGQYAGQPSYGYERGPDGQRYAVSGEVPISVSPISGDPEATIQKMRQVRSAALAPQNPSIADRKIAAEATRQLNAAYAELNQSVGAEFLQNPDQDAEDEKRTSSVMQTTGAESTDPSQFDPNARYVPQARSRMSLEADRAIESRYFGSVVPNQAQQLLYRV